MTKLVFRGLAVISACALVAVLAGTAVAQPAPIRVVQGTDGTLYLVQGGNAWPFVPDLIDDPDLAALNLGMEVDGTIPATLFGRPTTPAPVPPAPQAQIRVDVNKELNPVSTGNCDGPLANPSKLIVSLASVDRQADGRTVWHVGLLNHASVPISITHYASPSAAYMVASDGTKYDAFAIDDPTVVAVEELKALDLIPQQNNMPAGVYRLFFMAQRLIFLMDYNICNSWLWSSTPISLP
jgi:hypothetical protein